MKWIVLSVYAFFVCFSGLNASSDSKSFAQESVSENISIELGAFMNYFTYGNYSYPNSYLQQYFNTRQYGPNRNYGSPYAYPYSKRRDLPADLRRVDRAERNIAFGKKLPRKYRTCRSDQECHILPEQGCVLKCRGSMRGINRFGLEYMLNSVQGPQCMQRYQRSLKQKNSCRILPVCTKRGYCELRD